MLNRIPFPAVLICCAVAAGCDVRDFARETSVREHPGPSRVVFCTSCESVGTRTDAGDLRSYGFAVDAFDSGAGTPLYMDEQAVFDRASGTFLTEMIWPDSRELDFVARFPASERTTVLQDGVALCAVPSDGDVVAARVTGCREGVCPLEFEHCFARLDGVRLKFDSSFEGLTDGHAVSLKISVSDAAGYWKIPFSATEQPSWETGRISGCYPGSTTDLGLYSGVDLTESFASNIGSVGRGNEFRALNGLGLYLSVPEQVRLHVELMVGDRGDPDRYFLLRGSKPLPMKPGIAYDILLEFPSAGENDFRIDAVGSGWDDGGIFDMIY